MRGSPEPTAARPRRWRATWTVLDQAASSSTNFTMSFLILRSVSIGEFGAFTIAYTTYALALNIGRAVYGDPLLIRHTTRDAARWTEGTARATGTALLIGVAGGLLIALATVFTPARLRGPLLALAVVLPGLLLQDSLRFGFFAAMDPRKAFVNDLFWGVSQLTAVAALLLGGVRTVGLIVLAWGLSGMAAAGLGVYQARVPPRPRAWRRWVRANRDLTPRFLAEVSLGRGSRQLALYMVGAVAGLAALGALNGARVLMGPLNVAYLGVAPFLVSEGARMRSAGRDLRRLYVRTAGILASLAAALGLVFIFMPDELGSRLTASWPSIEPLMVPTAIWLAAVGTVVAWRSGLRALEAPRRSLRAQALTSSLVMTGTITGAAAGGAVGAATGIAAGNAVGSAGWLYQFRRALQEARAPGD